jgi:hypothetical protein
MRISSTTQRRNAPVWTLIQCFLRHAGKYDFSANRYTRGLLRFPISMHALFEDDGSLKAGTIHSETDATVQIELGSGRRVKVKTNAVLLRFAAPAAEELLKQAEAHAESIDLELLWETLSDADLTFQTIAPEIHRARRACNKPQHSCNCSRTRCISGSVAKGFSSARLKPS